MSDNNLPYVSICTPTYNRREFIPRIISCVKNQTYPKHLIEWVVIDDGIDLVKDLFEKIDWIKINYVSLKNKMKLGKKRNFMNNIANGDILIYMDDDDYYPPERLEHSVKSLINSEYLIAGCTINYIYFKDTKTIKKLGPYNKNHSLANNFCFKKELLLQTQFNDNLEFAEESEFLKKYTIPMLQLDPKYCCLIIAHNNNTVPKFNIKGKSTSLKLSDFIRDSKLINSYL